MTHPSAAAIDQLDAWREGDGWRYLADETGDCYDITDDELAELAEMLASGAPDAYSLWCAQTGTPAPAIRVYGEGEGDWAWASWMAREAGESDEAYLNRVAEEVRDTIIGHSGYDDEGGRSPADVAIYERVTYGAAATIVLEGADGVVADRYAVITSYEDGE